MGVDNTESLRAKIQRRYDDMMNVKPTLLHGRLRQIIDFLLKNELVFGIMDTLQNQYPDSRKCAEDIVERGGPLISLVDEGADAALCMSVLWLCHNSDNGSIETDLGKLYTRHIDVGVQLDFFRSRFVSTFFEFLLERVTDVDTVLALLVRYKKKCEWFCRDRFFQEMSNDTRNGEDILALKLYEYLHDAGVGFAIEARSISGKADLIVNQQGANPFLADVKVFKANTSKTYLASGFSQVLQYTKDHNCNIGYLIIYNASGKKMDFQLSCQYGVVPFLIHDHKTIYIMEIDINPVEVTASKLGKINPVVVRERDLIDIEKTEGLPS